MKSLELPCDANPRDRLMLARVGGCAAVTANEGQCGIQINLTPADARRAAAWLLEFAGEVEASLARVRAERECLPGCRTQTGCVNVGFCPACKAEQRLREVAP